MHMVCETYAGIPDERANLVERNATAGKSISGRSPNLRQGSCRRGAFWLQPQDVAVSAAHRGYRMYAKLVANVDCD